MQAVAGVDGLLSPAEAAKGADALEFDGPVLDHVVFAGHVEVDVGVGIFPLEPGYDSLNDGAVNQIVGGNGMVWKRGAFRHQDNRERAQQPHEFAILIAQY